MTYHAFICHPSQNEEIVENLADRLRELGIKAWVYSLDRTLAEDVWTEIEERIRDCHLFIFEKGDAARVRQDRHRVRRENGRAIRKANGGFSAMRRAIFMASSK